MFLTINKDTSVNSVIQQAAKHIQRSSLDDNEYCTKDWLKIMS